MERKRHARTHIAHCMIYCILTSVSTSACCLLNMLQRSTNFKTHCVKWSKSNHILQSACRTATMNPTQLTQAAKWSVTAPTYNGSRWIFTDLLGGRNYSTSYHVSRALGFFVAPKTGSYKFTLIGDDLYQLQGMYHNVRCCYVVLENKRLILCASWWDLDGEIGWPQHEHLCHWPTQCWMAANMHTCNMYT